MRIEDEEPTEIENTSSKPTNVKIVDKRCENTEELKIISANIKMTIIDLGIV